MASKCNTILIFLIILSLALPSRASTVEPAPTPTPWPHQFYSLLVGRNNGSLRIVDLWYDWPNGRNFNIIHHQLSYVLYDLEWNNGTSFFYTLDSSRRCSSMQFEVGILRPNWLDGANYLGQRRVDGFLCNVWEKVEFIWYYEDVITKRPVHWVFYDGMEAHVMTFEVGAVLEDEHWQATVYCFESDDKESASHPLPLPQPRFSSIGNFRNLYSISSDLFSVELGPRQQKFF